MKKLIAILVFCLACSPVMGEWRYDTNKDHKSVVRIVCNDTHGVTMGSGVVVKWGDYPQPIVATAAHVVRGARSITIRLVDGREVTAKQIGIDNSWDVALLQIPEVENLFYSQIETDGIPAVGEEVALCGYGANSKLAVDDGKVRQFVHPSEMRGPPDWVEINGHAREGDSGGPVFNRRGRVVGIISAKNEHRGTVIATQNGRIGVMMNNTIPRRIIVVPQVQPKPGPKPHLAPQPMPSPRMLRVIEFYADWCGACRQMEPVIAELRSRGVVVERINVDLKPEIAEQYGVTALPTTVIVSSGKIIHRVVGVTPARTILQFLLGRKPVEFTMGVNGLCPWNRKKPEPKKVEPPTVVTPPPPLPEPPPVVEPVAPPPEEKPEYNTLYCVLLFLAGGATAFFFYYVVQKK